MDPEIREQVLEGGGAYRDPDDEGKYDVDGEIDTDAWDTNARQQPRSPSPPPSYHQPQPDWGQGAVEGEDAYEPIPLDLTRRVPSDQEERDEEEASKWSHRKPTDPAPSVDDYEDSDDEYIDDEPRATLLRRRRMQAYRGVGWMGARDSTIDTLLSHPDVACQPRFNDLPVALDDDMRRLVLDTGPGTVRDPDYAWRTFWRFSDRNYCFFCVHRRTNEQRTYSEEFKLALEMMTRPLFDYDQEHLVKQLHNMFFVVFQPLLPPRAPCKRTGRPKPAHYLWASTIRRHMVHHMHRPVHDTVMEYNLLGKANELLSMTTFKRHKKNGSSDIQFDSARLRHIRDNIEQRRRLRADISKGQSLYRAP